jgi:transcriptional regulator with XRE-family HTH domain
MDFDRLKLKTRLFERKLHQYDFAKRLNITESYLSKILNGRAEPSNELLVEISRFLREK